MNRAVRRVATPAVVGTGLFAVLGMGVAGAFYQSNVQSTGTGKATPAAATTPLGLSATGAVGTGLYPGGPGVDVTVTITNPYSRPVTILAAAAAGAVQAVPVSGQTCATHGVAVTAPSSGLPVTVPANDSVSVTLQDVAQMGSNAENGCQGATFTIPFQVTGRL